MYHIVFDVHNVKQSALTNSSRYVTFDLVFAFFKYKQTQTLYIQVKACEICFIFILKIWKWLKKNEINKNGNEQS